MTEEIVTETPVETPVETPAEMVEPNVFATIVVPADQQVVAQDIAATFPGGAGMFVTGCSPDGALPATHYISTGWMDAGIPPALADVPGIVISDLPPFTVLADLGLQLVTDADPTDA